MPSSGIQQNKLYNSLLKGTSPTTHQPYGQYGIITFLTNKDLQLALTVNKFFLTNIFPVLTQRRFLYEKAVEYERSHNLSLIRSKNHLSKTKPGQARGEIS